MDEPNLELFDLDGFVINLNYALSKEEPIELGDFISTKPKRDTLLYRRDRKIETRGKHILYQPPEMPRLFNQEGKIGYILVESGYTNASSDHVRWYEKIILRMNRIDHPLKLRNGNIRKCGVEFLKEMEEGEYPDKDPDEGRTDYLLSWGGLFRAYVDDAAVKKYLRRVLPSEWFFGGGVAKEQRLGEAKYQEARRRRGMNIAPGIIIPYEK